MRVIPVSLLTLWTEEIRRGGGRSESGCLYTQENLKRVTNTHILQNPKLEETIAHLDPDSEALVKGHITYHATTLEGQPKLEPIFINESINPISLRLIGKIKTPDNNELASSAFRSLDKTYTTYAIPVTTEVASAITMTSAVLLMQSLAANQNQPDTKQQINTGMFLFAGVLATSVFIYDQIKSKHK